MPGPVIEGHKKYEQTCNKCHSVFSKSEKDKLCADCHKNIARDVAGKRGYHGRLKKQAKCVHCHTEHKGRDADIVKLNQAIFDHRQTDFVLKGAHAGAACDKCHEKKKKYHDVTSKCQICHKKINPHVIAKLKQRDRPLDCVACHNAIRWEEIQFDHDKTHFRLNGKHEPVKCINCHPKDQYQNTPVDCYACHRYDDVHKRDKGRACQKCHNAHGWKNLRFNHDKETKFPIKGRHKKLQCVGCHKEDPYKVKIKKECISCHKVDDRHNGRFAEKCNKCHKEDGWDEILFDHGKDTKFKLYGRHKKVVCEDCHSRNAYDHKTSMDCYSCHKKDDVHKKQQGENCNKCHNESGWQKKVIFDHDITRFPLLGLHSALACEECHLNNKYKDADKECASCHKKDDVHKGRLGLQCRACHNSNDWRVWRFDHDKQTEFKLDGKHKKLHCYDCHKKAVVNMKNQLSECNDCHSADDVHNGQFGRNCSRCHSTKTFKNARIKQ